MIQTINLVSLSKVLMNVYWNYRYKKRNVGTTDTSSEIRSDVLKQYRVQTLMSTIRRLYILYFYSNAY